VERGTTNKPERVTERKQRGCGKRGRWSSARVNALVARRAFLTPVLHRFE